MLRDDYTCIEAINDLKKYFEHSISNEQFREELYAYLDECLKANNLPMRHINGKVAEYRGKELDYYSPSKEEVDMLNDLMHFWG